VHAWTQAKPKRNHQWSGLAVFGMETTTFLRVAHFSGGSSSLLSVLKQLEIELGPLYKSF